MAGVITIWRVVSFATAMLEVETSQFYTKTSHFHQYHHHQHPPTPPDFSRGDLDDELQPLIIPTTHNLTVFPGERAVLRCRVENLGTKMVIWRKKGEIHPLTIGRHPFAAEPRLNVEHNPHSSEWTLVIQDVRPSDEGLYHCQISTKNDSENTFSILLNVRTIQVQGTEYVERGGVTQLKCNATGKPDPPLNLEWFKEGRKVTSDIGRGLLVTKKIETRLIISDLYIENTSLNDAGEYVCQSSDQDSAAITVYVLNGTNTKYRQTPHVHLSAGGRLPPDPWMVTCLMVSLLVSDVACAS